MSTHSSLRLRLQGLHYNLGCVLQQQGQLAAAADSYFRAIAVQQLDTALPASSTQLTTEQIKVYNNLGCVLVQQERWQEAIQVYQQAIQLQPEQGILHSNLGRVLFRQDPTEAIAAYRRAIQLEPTLVIAHHNLGLALQHQNQHEEALRCFQQVIRLEPDHATVHSDCAASWLALGQFKPMLESLRLAILPYREMVSAYCAQSYSITVSAGEQADALLAAKASCGQFLTDLMQQADPDLLYERLAQTYENWANVLTTYGGSEQYQRAELYYQRALKLQPHSLTLLLRLSHCLARQGLLQPERLNAAALTCHAALALYPSCPDLHRQLGQVLEQQQQFASAIECYQQALALTMQQSCATTVLPLPKSTRPLQGSYASTQDWAAANPMTATYIPISIGDWEKEGEATVNRLSQGAENQLSVADLLLDHQAEVPAAASIAGLPAGLEIGLELDQPVDSGEANSTCTEPTCTEPTCTEPTCAGLNCAACLKRIWHGFSPIHLGGGLHNCAGEGSPASCPPVPNFDRFVAVIPQGKAWIVPQQNAWMVCNAVAIFTAKDWLLSDLCRAYPGQLPTCQHAATQIYPVLAQTERPNLERLSGRVAVLSSLSGNTYFHWIVDVLPRLELLRRSGISLESIDWFLVNSDRHSFQRETLSQLGIPAAKIIASDQHPHIQATELIVPAFSGHFGWLEPWALSFLRQTFRPLRSPSSQSGSNPANPAVALSRGPQHTVRFSQADVKYGYRNPLQVSAALPERIYITRSNANHRQILNEAQVLEQVARLGFVSVELEALSFQQQVDLFAHAKLILAPHGSGLTNLVFCNPGATVIELVSPHYIRHYYWVISRLLGLKHYFLVGEVLPCYPVRELMYQNPLLEDIWINLDSLKSTLARLGLSVPSLCPA